MEPTAQLAPKVRPVRVMEHVMAITFLLLEAQRTHICVAKSALLVANPQASTVCTVFAKIRQVQMHHIS